ncbi:MAG: Hpt domain-containing protein [Psychrobium sp.]
MSVESPIDLDQVLELDILEQYTQAIGGQALLGSVDLFAGQYPEYLDELKAAYAAADYKLTAEHGHKMKGAAGAIGLARLSQWAQMLQNREDEAWLDNAPKLIECLESHYVSDIEKLRTYLSSC